MAPRSRRTSDTPARSSRTRHPAPKVQTVDRRVQRTRRHLRDSLITLIHEQGWDSVTVRDVCEHADVGRSTFYLHFADKENLLLSGFDTLHEELSSMTRGAKQTFAFAEPLLTHALAHERLFAALVGRQSGLQMQWRFRDLLVQLLTAELVALRLPAVSRASTARFLAGGFIEHLMEGLESEHQAEAGALAARFRRLALGVVEVAR